MTIELTKDELDFLLWSTGIMEGLASADKFDPARRAYIEKHTDLIRPKLLGPDYRSDFCEICGRYRVSQGGSSVCCCLGIQPYAMSTYPGEHNLVPAHPANSGEHWYKRADVDPLLRPTRPLAELAPDPRLAWFSGLHGPDQQG